MSSPFGDLPVFDAHAHFFSRRFFEALAEPLREGLGSGDPVIALTERLGIEPPEDDPARFAGRWVAEMDRHGVHRMLLMASVPGDEASIAAAVAAHPERISGSFMLDPRRPDAEETVRRALGPLGLRGVALFPAMHHFSAADERLWPIYRVAAEHGALVFVHFGMLKVAIRDRLGLPNRFDMRHSNPIDLHRAAMEFTTLKFQVPHFGCGYFREALMLGELCPNVHLDTSSSNSWMRQMPYPLTLDQVFRKAISTFGAERLLFGTDSTVFPRGWRADVFRDQAGVLQRLSLPREQIAAILGGNLSALLA